MHSRLRGIIPPMVTPLLDHETLDRAGLERLVEHLLAGGVHGLFVMGTTGEGPSLSHNLRYELVETTLSLVAGRVPVLVGITDTSFVESVDVADFAADAGAHAVVASTPYYFAPAQEELLEYLAELVEAVALPLVLYNLPQFTKVNFALDTVRRVLDWEQVIGIKDSAGDIEYFRQLVELTSQRPDWSVLIGPEELLAEAMRAGGHGGVCGGANMFPRLYVDLYEAAMRNDEQQVAALREEVGRVAQMIYTVGQHGSAFLKGTKGALSCLGICNDHMAMPFRRFQEQERAVLRERLEQLAESETPGIRQTFADRAVLADYR